MLQTIRDRAQGWIAWVIVILISIPFALWGVQSYLDVGSEPVAAEVNGVEITARDLDQRVQQTRMTLRDQLGSAYDPSAIDDAALRNEVLDRMVREALLIQVSNRLGMRVSDQELRAEILAEPAFQYDGRFDNAVYERALSFQGLSPAEFEVRLRAQMVGNQLARALSGSELITAAERDAFQRLTRQQREVGWVRISTERFESDAPVAEDAIAAYYDEHPSEFRVPEQVKLEYLVLDVARLAEGQGVTEEALRQAYEAEQARFGQPERRSVRHILRTVQPGADDSAAEAAVLAEIEDIRRRIEAGESFEEVAKALSQDPGSASQGGSLGTIEPGIMDPIFDQAAFALAAGSLSEPVKTRFGYHLIRVDEIVPASVKPFEEVRAELEQELSRQQAESLYYDLGERLANVVYEASDSLEPAAEELGLNIETSDWLARGDGGEGLLAHPKVLAAAFSEDVLMERRNSDLIEPDKEALQAIVVRVVEHRDATTRPLEEVREEIVARLRQERAAQAAQAAAEQAAEALRQGKPLAEVAGEDTLHEPKLVARGERDLPPEVSDLAFTLPAPAQGASSVGTVDLAGGDAAVVSVSKVEDGEVAEPAPGTPDPAESMLSQLMGRQTFDAVLDDMARRADIERKAAASQAEGD